MEKPRNAGAIRGFSLHVEVEPVPQIVVIARIWGHRRARLRRELALLHLTVSQQLCQSMNDPKVKSQGIYPSRVMISNFVIV
jgi:hypothetical protein